MAVGRKFRVLALVLVFGACALLMAGLSDMFDNLSIHKMYTHPYDTVYSWMMPKQRSRAHLSDMPNLTEEIMTISPLFVSTSAHVTIDPATTTTTPGTVYTARIKHLKNMCSNTSLIENAVYKGNSEIVYFLSKEYNFTYCKVPKTGCTFMAQTMAILKYGAEDKDIILTKERSRVHLQSKEFLIPFNSPERQRSRTVIITRNPFSRLLSAYLDKIYIPLFPSVFKTVHDLSLIESKQLNQALPHPLSEHMDNSSANCSSLVNFEGFLRLIIRNVRRGTILNRHWCPISQLCHPCDVNTYFIIKQESYSTDLSYFLQSLDIDSETLDVIFQAMTAQRAVTSLPGILSVIYTGINHGGRKAELVHRCFGLEGYHRRIWSALQMQGYINEEIEFPVDEIRAQDNDAEAMTNIILDTVERRPNSPEAMRAQRRKALVDAFRDVSEETVEEIRNIYRQDFELFGYSMNVPTE